MLVNDPASSSNSAFSRGCFAIADTIARIRNGSNVSLCCSLRFRRFSVSRNSSSAVTSISST